MNSRKYLSIILSILLIISFAPIASANSTVSSDQSVKNTNTKKGSNKVSDIIQVHKNKGKSLMQSAKKEVTSLSQKPEFSKAEVLVKFKTTISTQSVGTLEKEAGIKKSKDIGSTGVKLYKITNGNSVDQTIAKLKKSQNVAYAEPNYKLKNDTVSDPYYSNLWGLKNIGQYINGYYGTPGMDINAEAAWSKTTGSNVMIGVIDEGIDINHPDLKNNIWINPNEVPGDGIDNDHNGYVDDVNGWDFYNGDNSVYDYYDGDEHGTHVAGTIGASANNIGVIGVAPNVKLVSLKTFGSDGGYTSDAISAIQYAEKMGIKILNGSWGSYSYSQALYDAIQNYHGLFVAAAGNSAYNTDYTPQYPSSYNLPNILSVASIDNFGNLSYFSNYGVTSVDVAAPGEDIYSTAPSSYSYYYDYAYQYMSGTSMATPHVTGSAALVLATHPSYSANDIKQTLMETSKKLSSLTGLVASGGLVDVGTAVGYSADDDIPGTTLTGSKVSESLDATNDVDDVYAVTLSKGEKLTASLTGASGTDFDLYLYDKESTTVNSSTGILKYSEKAGTSSESFTFVAPNAGTYYLDTYAYKGKGTYSLSVTLGATAGVYENNSELLNYVSTSPWSVVSKSYASGGSYSTINTPSSSVELIFNGTGIQYNAVKDSQQGIARVTVDGVTQDVDLYSTISQYNTSVYEKTGLSSGVHTLKIEWTGQKNSSARKSATSINVDSIVVTNNQTATIEETNSTITYSGTWSSSSSSNYSGGTAKYSSTKGNSAELRFTGEGIKVVGYTGSNRGKADIYIDGKLVKTVDLYSSSTKYKVTLYSTSSLSKGSHIVKIVNRGEKSAASTGILVSLDAFVVSQKYGSYQTQETSSTLAYKGTWTKSTSSSYSGGTANYTSTAGNSVEYTFTGRGVKILSYTGTNKGMADIYVDGKLVKTVNMYSSSTVYQAPVYSVSGLSYGSHTIKVVAKGSKSSASTGTSIYIDAFVASPY